MTLSDPVLNRRLYRICRTAMPPKDKQQQIPLIKGSKNVEFHALRAIFRVASANSTNKGHRDISSRFFPLETILMISACCCGLSFGRRPPMCPCLRALSRPALVRSRSIARSNSANAPSICIAGDKGIIVTVCRPLLLGLIAEPR